MRVAIVVSALALMAAGALYVGTQFVPRQFDAIEPNAARAITASALQSWATNLLAAYPTNVILTRGQLGTNFPAPLAKLYHRPPDIVVYPALPGEPGHVLVSWGGGLIGNCGFEIGPPDFRPPGPHRRVWQAGVYFFTGK